METVSVEDYVAWLSNVEGMRQRAMLSGRPLNKPADYGVAGFDKGCGCPRGMNCGHRYLKPSTSRAAGKLVNEGRDVVCIEHGASSMRKYRDRKAATGYTNRCRACMNIYERDRKRRIRAQSRREQAVLHVRPPQ